MDVIIACPHHCNSCNLDFKNNTCYKKHLNTNRHIQRSSENSTVHILRCICGRSYSYHQSLYVHHKKCEQYKNNKNAGETVTTNPYITTPKTVQQKLDISEKERISQNNILKAMQQKINVFKKERKEMKDKIAVLQHNAANKCVVDSNISIIHQKSRDKRKKISKVVRQQVVNKQENACGECKLVLTPYFEIDHIIGLQFGGTDDESNLMAICRECHAEKSIKENQRRDKIKDAIQTILRE